MFQRNTTLRIEFFYRFDQDEKERTDISSHAGRIGNVKKFNIFIVVHPEVETLYLIVDFGADRTVGHGQIKTVINIQK